MAVEVGRSQRIAFEGPIGYIALDLYEAIPKADESSLWTEELLRLNGGMEDQ
jgi:hypothetical protein